MSLEMHRWQGLNVWIDKKSRRLMRISNEAGVVFEDRMYDKNIKEWELVG